MECRDHAHGFLKLEGPQMVSSPEIALGIVHVFVHVHLDGGEKVGMIYRDFSRFLSDSMTLKESKNIHFLFFFFFLRVRFILYMLHMHNKLFTLNLHLRKLRLRLGNRVTQGH